jgi:hypothetical protein
MWCRNVAIQTRNITLPGVFQLHRVSDLHVTAM